MDFVLIVVVVVAIMVGAPTLFFNWLHTHHVVGSKVSCLLCTATAYTDLAEASLHKELYAVKYGTVYICEACERRPDYKRHPSYARALEELDEFVLRLELETARRVPGYSYAQVVQEVKRLYGVDPYDISPAKVWYDGPKGRVVTKIKK